MSRDTVRSTKATRDAAIRQRGINIEDIRKESRTTQAVGGMLTRALNESSPTQGHERLYDDDFVGQVFDGTNADYTLTRRVLGQNVKLLHVVQASGSALRLTKTTNPAPSAGQFWFDGFFTVRVGTAPAALDGLVATYITAL